MAEHDTSEPLLADLVDLADFLQRDRKSDDEAIRRRDREIGRQHAQLSGRRCAQLRPWVQCMRNEPGGEAMHRGRRAVQAQRLSTLVLVLLGLVAGWFASIAVFHYDGTRPVNVVHVLAVFVGLQLLLLVLFVPAVLPRRLFRLIPGAAVVQESLQLLSPGRLQGAIARVLPQRHRDALRSALGRNEAHRRVYGLVEKWLVVWWSQCLAVAFNVGALAGTLSLIVFKDLAFGWSTTLRIDAPQFHKLVSTLAFPWKAWLPQTLPSFELVEATRFFRLKGGLLPGASDDFGADAAVLGDWWPFLMACMICYGLVPRIATLALARWRLASAARGALVRTPGAAQLYDRMNDERGDTAAPGPDTVAGADPRSDRDRSESRRELDVAGEPGSVINWAGIGISDDTLRDLVARRMGVSAEQVHHAGGTSTVEGDERVIATLSRQEHVVIILVKAWEPPVGELLDFLAALRGAVGEARPIIVSPVALDGEQRPAAPEPGQVGIWRRKLDTVADPWLDLRALVDGSP